MSSIDSHSDSGHHISSIPEADIASVHTTLWRIPGHDYNIELDQDVEDDRNMPGFELGWWKTSLLATPTCYIQTDSHAKLESSSRINTKVAHYFLVSEILPR